MMLGDIFSLYFALMENLDPKRGITSSHFLPYVSHMWAYNGKLCCKASRLACNPNLPFAHSKIKLYRGF